jgi:DNA repair exonuclease SbcCD ATPase subunit
MSKLTTDEIYDSNNHIKVTWNDTLDNHSKQKEREIEKYFQNKYKTTKVKVVFKPITTKNTDIVAEGSADASELVLDENYQKTLIEKYIKDNNITISLPHLMQLDSKVNLELTSYKEQTNRYKSFKIKEVEFSNFLSFGENNKISFDKYGITSVVSTPDNYGGKSTATIDLLLFLFFGTTTKTDKNEEVFNNFTDKNIVVVNGKIEIEGDNYMIKRSVIRKLSKDGSFTYKTELDFYQVLPRGGIKQLNGEERKFTDELIKTYVGTYDDFLITILTTGDNLEDLIKTKPTERGRILTRFIGLEFFREKESVCKKKYTEWKAKAKLSQNSVTDVTNKIAEEKNKINGNKQIIEHYALSLEGAKNKILLLEKDKEILLKSRSNDIDTELYKLDEDTIQNGIDKVTALIETKTNEIINLKSKTPEPKEKYDVDAYGLLKGKLKEHTESEIRERLEITAESNKLNMLINSEFCEMCKQPLPDIDHTNEIQALKVRIATKNRLWEAVKENIISVTKSIQHLDQIKTQWDEYNKNILINEKLNLELKSYKESLLRGQEKLTQYRKVKDMVKKNKELDTDIEQLNNKLPNLNEEKDMLALQIQSTTNQIKDSEAKILEFENLIAEIKKEEVIDHIYQVYLEIYGKNGISKMVLATMIPLINIHLDLLLSDSCEFTLELKINDKSEVDFWIIDNESQVRKPLKSGSGYEKTVSSLALRCVLSKICSLPKPNIIVFDEITGKVANSNLEKVGLFFDKLKQFFEHIWIISHNPLIQDWADTVIKIKKENNISTIIEN